jgi:DNA-binding response OmpR family regulator
VIRRSILCVDDEPNVLILRRTLLGNAGYKVHVAEDGEKGLEVFRNESVDLVVLDYKMPRMLGDEVAREMRRLRRDVPLLLVTAFHDLPTTCTSVFDGVILKGEAPEVLLTRIKQLLEVR